MNPHISRRLLDRLRREEVTTTVSGTWPQLWLGNLQTAEFLTLGIDPAARGEKFVSTKADRLNADEPEVEPVVQEASNAFTDELHPWFQPHEEFLEGYGLSYSKGEAAHVDLIQERLIQPWSDWHGLNAEGADTLLRRDITFATWLIEAFPIKTVLCTSRMVLDNMLPQLGGRVIKQGSVDKFRWMIAEGVAAGRPIRVLGWNLPLTRVPEFDAAQRRALGKTLRKAVKEEFED